MTIIAIRKAPWARLCRYTLLGVLLIANTAISEIVRGNQGAAIQRDNLADFDFCVSAIDRAPFTVFTIVHPSHLTIDGERLAYIGTSLTFLGNAPARSFTTSFDADTQDGYGKVGMLLLKEQIGKASLVFDYDGFLLSFEDLAFLDDGRYIDDIQRPCD